MDENKTTENTEDMTENGEEKKQSKISGFFKKVSKKLDDATYSMRLLNNFASNHSKYTVYCGTSILTPSPEISAEEHIDEGYLVTIDDDDEIAAGNLIKNNQTGEVRHIAATEKTTLDVEFENKKNSMPAIKIVLGEKAVKADVIKVDDAFYLK